MQSSTDASRVLRLVEERRAAERRYRKARSLPERRAALHDLLTVKDELARYRRAQIGGTIATDSGRTAALPFRKNSRTVASGSAVMGVS